MIRKPILRLLLPLALALTALPSRAAVSISVSIGPPVLPVYAQPLCPGDGYIWTPGYWAWDDDDGDYYWVPGTWVLAPRPGYLWTPGWWGWSAGYYVWHPGYWGPHVGFYGGVNYGYGYGGRGYEGGRWQGDRFYYNRAVTNINVTNIHNTYNTTVINNVTVNRVSYNGGDGGVKLQPTAQERNAERERHVFATQDQSRHEQVARENPELKMRANQGRPVIAATARPAEFQGRDVVPALGADAGSPNERRDRGPAERDHPGGNGGATDPARGGQDRQPREANRPQLDAPQSPREPRSRQDSPYPRESQPSPQDRYGADQAPRQPQRIERLSPRDRPQQYQQPQQPQQPRQDYPAPREPRGAPQDGGYGQPREYSQPREPRQSPREAYAPPRGPQPPQDAPSRGPQPYARPQMQEPPQRAPQGPTHGPSRGPEPGRDAPPPRDGGRDHDRR